MIGPQIRSVLAVLFLWSGLSAESLTVIGFNVESGGANPNDVARIVADFNGCDIWGFSEVQNSQWASIFEQAAEVGENADFQSILGTTGGADRLLITYNANRLEKMEHFELHDINVGGNVRAPLVARFRIRSNGQEFLFMVNHLYRSNTVRRHQQASLLNQWAAAQTLPVIAVGDYNFDWDAQAGDTNHDQGFDLLTANDIFRWVRPPRLVRTQCSFDSVLDFVFTAGEARNWATGSEILFADSPAYCPDTPATSDHRPLLARFQTDAAPQPVTREEILMRIARLEEELRGLRQLAERLP